MTTGLTREERLYRYTVRTLYVVALTLNAIIIWDQVKTTPEWKELANRFAKGQEKAIQRYRDAKKLKAAENWVVFEAMTILEEEGNAPNAG